MLDINELRDLLRGGHRAVLTMASGGCSRYAFSADVPYRIAEDGWPVLTYADSDGSVSQMLRRSGLHFIVPVAEGDLVLGGQMEPMPAPPSNEQREFRFVPSHAYVQRHSGERVTVWQRKPAG